MCAIALPILIAIDQDMKKAKLDLMIVLAPLTLAWVLLIVPLIYNEVHISKKLNEIRSVGNLEQFKHLPPHMKYVRGRNTKHPYLC